MVVQGFPGCQDVLQPRHDKLRLHAAAAAHLAVCPCLIAQLFSPAKGPYRPKQVPSLMQSKCRGLAPSPSRCAERCLHTRGFTKRCAQARQLRTCGAPVQPGPCRRTRRFVARSSAL